MKTTKTQIAVAMLLLLGAARAGAAVAVHDLSPDFSLDTNPNPAGWQYSESVANGGGPVGSASQDWNQPDFGPGQSGWLGILPGAHAGWAKRVDNSNGGANTAPVYALPFDAPVGTVMTHGDTSVLWKAPANDPNHYATISGGEWNLRHFGRSGQWRIYVNNNIITQGSIDDSIGTSATPVNFNSGSGGADALTAIHYSPGDIFRFETTEADFQGIQFTVTTTDVAPDPDITAPPQGTSVFEGSTLVLNVTATGTAPLSYEWSFNGNPIANQTSATLSIPNVRLDQQGSYAVKVTNSKGSRSSQPVTVSVQPSVVSSVHDLAADFSLDSNPTQLGWQYSMSVANGGGPVGAADPNWNAPDFGPGQPGWLGITPGPHAGWAKKIDNGTGVHPEYDAPVGTILTHGDTSVLWKSPSNDPNHFATVTGSIYNLRHLGRSGSWRIYKNSTILTQGGIDDNSGSSVAPLTFDKGSGGSGALTGVPYVPGDIFRFETTEADFQGVSFTITTSNTGPDPDIATQPQSQLVSEGANVTLSVAAVGTQPLSYKWQLNNQDIANETSSTLQLNNIKAEQSGSYTVIASNSKGSITSKPAAVVVDAPAPVQAGIHDLASDFTFLGNPTSRGWQYSEALSTGGDAVGALNGNWNSDTFGPGQPGYDGVKAGAFAGWAKRVNNGTLDAFDAPVGTIMTHGPTSVRYKVQPGETDKFATITGNLWSVEKNDRGQGWNIWKNDNVLLATGVFSGGTSDQPNAFETADGSQNLQGIPIKPGDTFRLEILPTSGPGGQLHGPYGDFQGVNLKVATSAQGPDPAIADQPLSQIAVEGSDVTLHVGAVGTAPFTYQWQFEGNPVSGANVAGATSDTLKISNVALSQAGHYSVVVSNSKGSAPSVVAQLAVTPKPQEAHGVRYDLADDFSLDANPTPKGWQYSESSVAFPPGNPVGPVTQNWNQPDYGPGQPGWLGNLVGTYAGWAKRKPNFQTGAPGDTYDWPVGVVLTHGPTSAKWTAPADLRAGSVADISGGLWNVRHLNRGTLWHIFFNDTQILTEGQVVDASGSSAVPEPFTAGSGGAAALKQIPIQPGDSLRFELVGNPAGGAYDFVAINFTIVVRNVHDAAADFDATANPSPSGWQYSQSVANGGGPVGPFTQDWNQPDFGAGQTGWQGLSNPGVHAGWAKRIDNGNGTDTTPTFDDPIGSIMTHGPTSILWKAPTGDPGGSASLSGGLWNLRHLGRSGTWNVYKNGTILTSGSINDTSGTSSTPLRLGSGSGGDAALNIPYTAGDEFRLEVLQADFTGVKFTVETYPASATPQQAHLTISLSGANALINWDAPGTLESSTTVNSGYATVPNVTGTSYQAPINAAAHTFFRVKQ